MIEPNNALNMLAEAYNCPDVAITETIEIIQLDAFKAGMYHAAALIFRGKKVKRDSFARILLAANKLKKLDYTGRMYETN